VYAVVQSGGKQHKVKVGQTFLLDKMDAAEAGATIELDQVVLIGEDDRTIVGRPTIDGAKVVATIANPDERGEKLIVFKYKPKVRYRKKTGHRQHYTRVLVNEIVTGEGA
jgi:large subunit ribosomal protein L21